MNVISVTVTLLIRDTMTKHKQSKHEGVRYECDQCDCKTTQLGSLTAHIAVQTRRSAI